MKSMIALLFLTFAGCASAPTRHTLDAAPQACEEFCHDYALGLVDLGAAGQAGPVFDIAEKHFIETARPDIPKKDWERAAMRVELALGRAATARVLGEDIQKPLISAVNAFSELLALEAPKVWNWIALDFLREADILRFDREWDGLNVDPGARFVLRQFLLVQRGAAPDLLLIKKRAETVKGVNQLVALAYILSKSGDVRTVIAQGVNERLFDELKTADVASQQVVLEMALTADFVNWATPQYQDSVRWIMQKATELEVRGDFMPVTAFADISERCEVIKPYYKTLVARVRNDIGALDLVLGCLIRWGGYAEIMNRMNQLDPSDARTHQWTMLAVGYREPALTLLETDDPWTLLLNGNTPKFATPQMNGFPWDELVQLRQARTSADFASALLRFVKYPNWFFWRSPYLIVNANESVKSRLFNDLNGLDKTSGWQVLNGGSFDQSGYCNEASLAAFAEAQRTGIKSALSFLNLPPKCEWQQAWLRNSFIAAKYREELASALENCSDEALKPKGPKSNKGIWCDVVLHRVRDRAQALEESKIRYERDTAVHVLIALKNFTEARRIFETYNRVGLHDYMTDQLLRAHEGKALDISLIRFVSFIVQTFPEQGIVPALWAAGRHEEACEVLTVLTTVRPWVAHPGEVDCPATNAAYKERWGFDPPWTLPQDEILAFLRQAPETK